MRNITKSQKLLILADKTDNLYKLTTDKYKKLLTGNISKAYKKSTLSTMHNIITETKVFKQDLQLDERTEQLNQQELFITLKN